MRPSPQASFAPSDRPRGARSYHLHGFADLAAGGGLSARVPVTRSAGDSRLTPPRARPEARMEDGAMSQSVRVGWLTLAACVAAGDAFAGPPRPGDPA